MIAMKISTEIASIAEKVGMEKAVELCAKAGFDAWDFSMFDMCRMDWETGLPVQSEKPLNARNYLKFARKLKKIGLDNGIVCNQSHAPFPVEVPAIRSSLKLAIECTAEAGGEICVIHPDDNKTAEENAEMYLELLPFAKSCGVKIATENMWNWDGSKGESSFAACATGEDFKKHIDIIHDDFFVACLDLGHAEMRGSGDGAVNMIRALGHRIQALHIHDNDRWHDYHQIPFSMNIDFGAIVKALQEIHYEGYFTLEEDAFLKDYHTSDVFDGVVKLKESAKKLADMFEQR
jgi:sugar phosphate isomerase/epimerase